MRKIIILTTIGLVVQTIERISLQIAFAIILSTDACTSNRLDKTLPKCLHKKQILKRLRFKKCLFSLQFANL